MKPFLAKCWVITLALYPPGTGLGQAPICVSFDGPPTLPPGSTVGMAYYGENGVNVISIGGSFTRRWSGNPLFPDNGSAYAQPGQSTNLRFTRGSTFKPVAVDLALYSTASLEPVTIWFVGKGYSGELMAAKEFIVSGVLDNQGRPSFRTFDFGPEFPSVLHLEVAQTPMWSLDNLVAFIPEPSSGALLMLSGLTFWLVRRPCKAVGG